MKISCVIMILAFNTLCLTVFSQDTTTRRVKITKTFKKEISPEKAINNLADSINRIADNDSFPTFLLDGCFELNYSSLRESFHSFESVRWEVLKRVSNKTALERILKSPNDKLNAKCDSPKKLSPEIPYQGMTFYDLVKLRYEELIKIPK